MSAIGEEIGALLRRAEALKDQAGLPDSTRAFWRGYAKGLRDLQTGWGKKAAAKDSAAQHRPGMGRGANTALPVHGDGFAAADVPKLVAAEYIQVAGHLVADFEVNAVQQLENHELPGLVAHNEQAASAIDANDGAARHVPSGVISRSMAHQHGAFAASNRSIESEGAA